MTGLKEPGWKRKATRLACLCAMLFCACVCVLTVTAAAEPADENKAQTWEERLEQARNKYNEKTVNIYSRNRGWKQKGKMNVRYVSSRLPYLYIMIRDSLKITDEAEMQAILEVVARDDRYSEELYGTISFMKAEWIAHNLAHSMATGTEHQQNLVKSIAGESLSMVLARSEELDLEPIEYINPKELLVYEFIEFVYALDGH